MTIEELLYKDESDSSTCPAFNFRIVSSVFLCFIFNFCSFNIRMEVMKVTRILSIIRVIGVLVLCIFIIDYALILSPEIDPYSTRIYYFSISI